ncbi:hypothetical protein [Winogradskyella algicola]|uniref:hypothetical protein n=1 Tax=Winogradskyella algicola TaxID=2575815 RepID=UPI0011090BAE|nr:hypothetical protein [Winogradskyella algicola]
MNPKETQEEILERLKKEHKPKGISTSTIIIGLALVIGVITKQQIVLPAIIIVGLIFLGKRVLKKKR